ncbi:acetyltransferase [Niallia nealsonii AAU1]|nr:acetyltransferase [Niallia nealsonii AAU1]
MDIALIDKQITLDEVEILREPLEKLHKYHNRKSKYNLACFLKNCCFLIGKMNEWEK